MLLFLIPTYVMVIEKECIEYRTPSDTHHFPAGTTGLVNSNILHMTVSSQTESETIQLLHLFSPVFISGNIGSKIEHNYVLPLTNALNLELVSILPDTQEQELLQLIRNSFTLSESEMGYELQLRSTLSEIWLHIYKLVLQLLGTAHYEKHYHDKIKQMMTYIQNHYKGKTAVAEIASSAYLSERECYHIFKNCLHMSPVDYLNSYRIQMACQMLQDSSESITYISHECGFGSSSYFGKLFKNSVGCTPLEYRKRRFL